MTDLTYDCLEMMDQLVYQSTKGFHILFERSDIVRAIQDNDPSLEENTVEKLKLIQELLYGFIKLKTFEEKKVYLKKLNKRDTTLLIRAYFKIVDNSILNKTGDKH